MAMDTESPRSRRAILAAAAGAAGALAASAALPAVVAAHDPEDVQKGTDNATTTTTTVTNSGADSTALAGHATGTGSGYGLEGTSTGGAGVFAWSESAPSWDPPFEAAFTATTGVFGYAPAGDGVNTFGSGVWGDSPYTGVYGSGGDWGVYGYGGVGVQGEAAGTGGVALYGYASTSQFGLVAQGKVRFTNRAGRVAVSSGKSSVAITVPGATSTSRAFAVFASSESGRWVRAVVPATGKITVYFNTTLSSSATVSWFLLD